VFCFLYYNIHMSKNLLCLVHIFVFINVYTYMEKKIENEVETKLGYIWQYKKIK